MRILNLDPEFNPFPSKNDQRILNWKSISFPSNCERHFEFDVKIDDSVFITTRIQSSDNIMELLLVTDALKRMGIKEIYLFIPYLPYARQDRVMMPGQPLSLKVMCDLINSQNYEQVYIYDVHSDVATALLNNVTNIPNHSFIKRIIKDEHVIVCPDAGAAKKIHSLCTALGYDKEIIQCDKIRSVKTGNIIGLRINADDLTGKRMFIVDDICDGGATFIRTAKELKRLRCKSVELAISHGIFSKGYSIDYIDQIFCTDSFKDLPTMSYISQIGLNHCLDIINKKITW